MISLVRKEKDLVSVYEDGIWLGAIRLSENPFHRQNCYIELELACYDDGISAELFEKLFSMVGQPLQAMFDSEETDTAAFLAAGGFVRRRRCYEVNGARADYLGGTSDAVLCRAHEGDAAYDLCCAIMYDRYRALHRDISPWTSDLRVFRNQLTPEVLYEADGDAVVHLAFVSGNEIAYVCSADPARFPGFAAALIRTLLAEHETVFFESDDCDWAAMSLRAMFADQKDTSFDTYIYDGGR